MSNQYKSFDVQKQKMAKILTIMTINYYMWHEIDPTMSYIRVIFFCLFVLSFYQPLMNHLENPFRVVCGTQKTLNDPIPGPHFCQHLYTTGWYYCTRCDAKSMPSTCSSFFFFSSESWILWTFLLFVFEATRTPHLKSLYGNNSLYMYTICSIHGPKNALEVP